MSGQIISAGDAGKALNIIAERMIDSQVLTPEGYSALHAAAVKLKRGRDNTNWKTEVGYGNPIRFSKIPDKSGKMVTPNLICAIEVDQTGGARPPFAQLDLTLEIVDDESGSALSRWHIDLANSDDHGIFQDGPLIHLQYGGHKPGFREIDHRLKVPRWCHPPMELALMCEVVAANFFPEKWNGIRDDSNWCWAICLYQKLCFSAYLDKLHRGMSVSSTTLLKSVWAGVWN